MNLCFIFCLISTSLVFTFVSAGSNVTYDSRSLIIDGQRKLLISAAIHYPRSVPAIDTCNSFYCDQFTPTSPNRPKIWTENWPGWLVYILTQLEHALPSFLTPMIKMIRQWNFETHRITCQHGLAWLNGEEIGRYWPRLSEFKKEDCVEECDYRGKFNPDKCVTGCGEPTQRWYHVPRSWFKPSGNVLVFFEEKGGDPTKITFARRKVV
ncbi:hypothetical protein RYX36_014122 [Vicia faba]